MAICKFKELAKNLLIERDASTLPEKCSTQVNLPESIAKHIIQLSKLVSDEHLHEYGRENEPHVTALYGITPTPSAMAETMAAIKECGKQNITVKFGDLSKFSNPEFDVLKFEMISEDLRQLNSHLRNRVDFQNDYPDYNPHLTIAYVKPGMGDFYIQKMKDVIGNRLSGKSIKFDTVMFSDINHKKTPIKLGYPQSGPVEHPNTKAELTEDLGYGAGMPGGNAYMSGHHGVYHSPSTRQDQGSFGGYKRYNMTNNNTVVSSGYYDTVFNEDIIKMMKIFKALGFKADWPSNADDYEKEIHLSNPRRADQTHTMSDMHQDVSNEDDALPSQGGINLSNQTIIRHLKAEFGDELMDMHKFTNEKITYDEIMLGLQDVMSDLQYPDKDYAFLRVLKTLIKTPTYYSQLGKYDINENVERTIYGTKFKPNVIKHILRGIK